MGCGILQKGSLASCRAQGDFTVSEHGRQRGEFITKSRGACGEGAQGVGDKKGTESSG